MRGKSGFTLIEVLIVIIIIGILATIAVPQFANMITRARLAEAWSGLGAGRAAVEVYKLENNDSYLGMTIASLGITSTNNFDFTFVNSSGTLVVTTTAAGYILRATGNGSGNASVANTVMAEVRQDGGRRSTITGDAGLLASNWSY